MPVIFEIQNQIRNIIINAAKDAFSSGELASAELAPFAVEIPAERANGDFSSNAALVNARVLRSKPAAIAEAIISHADLKGTYISRIEAAGPGFLNFFVSQSYYSAVLLDIEASDGEYGRSDFGKGEKVNVEFVSANPTGPMHMGNARGGALGDCLAAVLDYAGYDVSREFYVNDAGNQIEKFALSLSVRYQQLFLGEDAVELPEDSYHGDDIIQRAKEFAEIHGDAYLKAGEDERRKALVAFALPKNIAGMKEAMSRYRIEYDTWFSELSLHKDGELDEVVDILKKNGYTYEKDGALWYKNKEVQTELLLRQGKSQKQIDRLELKDDVLIRANGNPTYFLADIAYHRNKLEKRGFSRAIDIWGADHHGHVARMKGAMEALGIDSDRLIVILMQLVRLMNGNEVVRMSKRTGKAISLTDLLDEVPIDAVRFLFNTNEPGSTMDFDLSVALEQSAKNPVYYCQYAHARICSIKAKLAAEGKDAGECGEEQLDLLTAPEEKELIAHLASLPEVIANAAKNLDPVKLTQYAVILAGMFHKFYNACRVNVDDVDLMRARLYLCLRVKDAMKSILNLMKINAPEKM